MTQMECYVFVDDILDEGAPVELWAWERSISRKLNN